MRKAISIGGILTFLFMFLHFSSVFAQSLPGGGNDVPIDGGASLLAAAGVAYGAKKIHDKRKKNSSEAEN